MFTNNFINQSKALMQLDFPHTQSSTHEARGRITFYAVAILLRTLPKTDAVA